MFCEWLQWQCTICINLTSSGKSESWWALKLCFALYSIIWACFSCSCDPIRLLKVYTGILLGVWLLIDVKLDVFEFASVLRRGLVLLVSMLLLMLELGILLSCEQEKILKWDQRAQVDITLRQGNAKTWREETGWRPQTFRTLKKNLFTNCVRLYKGHPRKNN